MAVVCFCLQPDEKLPSGSLQLVAQQVFPICFIVLLASLKTGGHVVDFNEISYPCDSTKEMGICPEKLPPTYMAQD